MQNLQRTPDQRVSILHHFSFYIIISYSLYATSNYNNYNNFFLVIKENPTLSAVEVARKITDIWKHLPSQEHGYYQDLVREERENKEKAKKEKLKQKLDEDVKKNRRRLLRMLENMKNSNTQKSENLAMRTTVPWDMNIEKVTKSFQNR